MFYPYIFPLALATGPLRSITGVKSVNEKIASGWALTNCAKDPQFLVPIKESSGSGIITFGRVRHIEPTENS